MTTTDPQTPQSPPSILILCTDLLFSTKITGTAKALQQNYAVARTLEKLDQLLTTATPNPLLIIDLNITQLDPIAAITQGKSHPNPPRILAFVSHVDANLAAAAKSAGADRVLARSAFSEQLPQLLK